MAATSIEFDPGKVSRLIGLGYEAALDRAAWRAFAGEMAAMSGSELALIQYHDADNPERSFIVSGGLGGEFEEAFAQTSWRSEDDRFWVAIRSKPACTVALSHEIVPPEVMHKSRDYARVAMPWKLDHFLISNFTNCDGVSAILSLGRTAGKPPYQPGDKPLFSQMVLSHLERSIAAARELEATRASNSVLSAIFHRAPYGMVAFNYRGRIIAVNETAAQIFESKQGLTVINGRLHATDPSAHAGLENALLGSLYALSGTPIGPPDPVIVPRQKQPHQPYHVIFAELPLKGGDGGRVPAGSAVVALLHEGWLSGSAYQPMLLRRNYGLTRAEIRLCESLLAGNTLAEAAASAAISRNTAKTHLSRVFSKTGVSSQAELMRLLTKGTPRKITKA